MAKRVHLDGTAVARLRSTQTSPSFSTGKMVAGLSIALLPFAACTADSLIDPSAGGEPSAAVVSTDAVEDLTLSQGADSTIIVRWTQVDDGTGDPARYRVKYATPPIDWSSADHGCDATGDEIGAEASCTIRGLEPGVTYDFQLMSYRVRGRSWSGAAYSNIATGAVTTSDWTDTHPVSDLEVAAATDSTFSVRWTQVDDGTGEPARYRVKYATAPIVWSSAERACDVTGDQIGAEASCTIEGLDAGNTYDVQLMSYRVVQGTWIWEGATYSNIATEEATNTSVNSGTTEVTGTVLTVEDLEITGSTEFSSTTRWTQVDDGTGQPARYRVKYATPPIDWSSAAHGCDVTGDQIGGAASCTIDGLDSGTTYDVQLMSYRLAEGSWNWEGANYSNIATDATEPSSTSFPTSDAGVWISQAEISALPTSGSAWNNVLSEANRDCGVVDLADQTQATNVCVMAKALVFARSGGSSYRTDVVRAITQIVTASSYDGRALALGRELGAYVIAADLIDLKSHDPALDGLFRTTLVTLRTTYTTGAASSLVDCHEKRPNNWGAHCGATRAAIAVYLDDTDDLARTAQVFKGYLGDRSSYAGFEYGGPASENDLSWQCDETSPVGINPRGCVKEGLSMDGLMPDDQRRGGSFTVSPPQENYVWEALQGMLAQAVILHRAGYPVWEWEDRALLRAVEWLHDVVDYPAEGDDTWQPHVVNHYYGTNFPATTPSRAGKNVGWTDWTHR